MVQSKKTVDYRALNLELETIMSNLQDDNLDIDQAISQYARGLELIGILQDYLKTAENKVKALRLKLTPES